MSDAYASDSRYGSCVFSLPLTLLLNCYLANLKAGLGLSYTLDDLDIVFIEVPEDKHSAEVPMVLLVLPKDQLIAGEKAWSLKAKDLSARSFPIPDLRSYRKGAKKGEHKYINWELALWMGPTEGTQLVVPFSQVRFTFVPHNSLSCVPFYICNRKGDDAKTAESRYLRIRSTMNAPNSPIHAQTDEHDSSEEESSDQDPTEDASQLVASTVKLNIQASSSTQTFYIKSLNATTYHVCKGHYGAYIGVQSVTGLNRCSRC
jgi:hypothetical protein